MNESRACATCGKAFDAKRPEARYCCPDCYAVAYGAALSLADLERDGRVWGEGDRRRALCPLCGDEHARDRAHACLALDVKTGAWTCHRCDAAGLLREHWTPPGVADPLRQAVHLKRGRRPAPRSAPPPTPAAQAEDARRTADAARLWRAAVAIDAPQAEAGAAYLAGRGIPLAVAVAAGVRYHARYPDGTGEATHYHGAVVFRVQDAEGKGVAIETRYLEPRPDSNKGKSRGPKGRGVFVTTPDALDVDGVTLCEGPLTALSVAACGFACVALCGQKAPPWLARRLALRDVVIALDEGETKTEAAAADLVRQLVTVGARPYRLRLPAGVDVNDRLQAVGVDALRAELADAIAGALSRG